MGSHRLGMEPFHIIHGETLGKLWAFVAPGQHQEGVLVCTVPHNSCTVICITGQGCWENDMPLPSSFLKCFNYWISSFDLQLQTQSILQDKNKFVKNSLKIKNTVLRNTCKKCNVTLTGYLQFWNAELRSCVKVKVAVLGSHP